ATMSADITTASCQWLHWVDAKDPASWSPDQGRAYGEDIHATYYYWAYPKSEGLPEGTKILIEGDFPHARFMDFQAAPPSDPAYLDWRTGEGAPEIPLLDEDIEPDPRNVNPFRPGADRNATARHYHVTFELRAGQPVALNPHAGVPPYRAPGNTR